MRRDYKQLVLVLLVISILAFLILVLNSSRDSPVNVNTASQKALESLPGIGEVLAKRIIDNRPYRDIYDLDKVKGIGPKTVEKIQDRAVVR